MSQRPDVILLYGESDTGKTVQLGLLARWWFDRTGEISRLISSDSGWQSIDPKDIITPSNPEGIIEAWNVQGLPDPWSPMIATTEGQWPVAVLKEDGTWKPKMLKPVLKDGRILGAGGRPVGQYFYEGISTLGNVGLMDHIRTQRQLGQDLVGKFSSSFDETDSAGKSSQRTLAFAKAAPSHYGQVQDWILLDMVPRSGRLPVSRVVWTGHEAKGTDDLTGTKNSALGPATVGVATVDRTVQKFAHSFHLTSSTSFSGDKNRPTINREFRAWFIKHPDEVLTQMKWPTKVSLSVAQSQALLKRFPGGYIPLTVDKGLEQFFEFLASSDQQAKGASK